MTMNSCASGKEENTVLQLTHTAGGHTLHHNNVFSPDGQWIVFDGRNDDTKIGETSVIGVVHVKTGEEKELYQTKNPTRYGPGVGAASFSPVADRVIFIHGLANADKEKPYDISRRTGVAIDLERPLQPVFMDARDITAPYTPGALRGGTHSHCWSGDGHMISFTYNDALIEPELRTVGVMFDAGRPVLVNAFDGNNSGQLYAAVVADVVAHPQSGSDEISKAFDECWVGKDGYTDGAGRRIPYAIAFQGNTVNKKGETITELFIADLDPEEILKDTAAVGIAGERPHVPKGVRVQRISRTGRGLSHVRHWLRSSPDGRFIYALAPDDKGIAQVVRYAVSGGQATYITKNATPIDYSFNLNKEGTRIAYVTDNNVYLYDLLKHANMRLTFNEPGDLKIAGAPSFSPDGHLLVYNQYRPAGPQQYLQIMTVAVK
ncbi:DUF3748 domain-containing protein [Niabella pedocola]|uniref:DUF3748 domain-containing protein n=1 Tax=Niabella pedocola TaxID=1752077 RepID=A0ABS8PP50_9BACT|nr:DUF3748 domain-containing protein [Niabella pedocola]MCD2422650.1 DUF3748 domain-containing protein [Niabella pedocola]